MNDKLWPIPVETVHALVMYTNHEAYIRSTIMTENPDTTATELAVRLNMPIGEALVILHELAKETSVSPPM